MEKKKTYLYIYVCMAALLFVGAAISLSVGSAEIGIIGSIKLALSGIPGIGQFVDISAYSTMQRYIILQVPASSFACRACWCRTFGSGRRVSGDFSKSAC